MPPSSDPSWRGSANKPTPGVHRSWRRPVGSTARAFTPQNRWLQSIQGAISGIFAIAIFVLFIALIFTPSCRQTQFSVVDPVPYSSPSTLGLPFATQDSDEFLRRFNPKGETRHLLAPLKALASPDSSTTQNFLKSISTSNPERHPLFLYVAALAGYSNGKVVILLENAEPDEPGSERNSKGYLPLERIAEMLRLLPAEQPKVIAVDFAGREIDWRWGQFLRPALGTLTDKTHFVGTVDDAFSEIKNLAILTSAANGETSWSSPSLKRSIFAHSLIRALSGEADGYSDGRKDLKVTLREAHDFILKETNHWVKHNRDRAGQHPQMLLSSDFIDNWEGTVIHEVKGNTPKEPRPQSPNSIGDHKKDLTRLWSARDELSKKEPEQWHPLAWRQLQEAIRRAERCWIDGVPDEMEPYLHAAALAEQAVKRRHSIRIKSKSNIQFRDQKIFFGGIETPEQQLTGVFANTSFFPATPIIPNTDDYIKLRRYAEEQSWHSFRSRLWTGSLLDEADRHRRSAEDLIFVGGEELESSRIQLQQATSKLDEHRELVDEISDLIKLHHRLLSELPDLARWAAQRLPDNSAIKSASDEYRSELLDIYSSLIHENKGRPPQKEELEAKFPENNKNGFTVTEVELLILFDQTRQLGRLLDQERSDGSVAFVDPKHRDKRRGLKASLTHKEHGLDALLSRLTKNAEQLIGSTDGGQKQNFHWRNVRNALHWNGLPADGRKRLFEQLEKTNDTTFSQTPEADKSLEADRVESDSSAVSGCWQALWALQTLSLGASSKEEYQEWIDLKNAWRDRNKTTVDLLKLGDFVRAEFRGRAWTAANRIAVNTVDLGSAYRILLETERAVRTLDAYDAVKDTMTNIVDNDPIQRLQDFDVAALCIKQADRYLDDFWQTASVGGEVWYVKAVHQCLLQAEKQELVKHELLGKSRLNERRTAKLAIARSNNNRIELGRKDYDLTTVDVKVDSKLPDGTAAMWLENGRDPKSPIIEFGPVNRRKITSNSPTAEFSIRKQPFQAESICEEIPIRPRLLFRAKFWEDDEYALLVNPCPPKSIDRTYQAPPETGSIVVSGNDRRDTIFILDCSYSMKESKDGGPMRFKNATRALTEILRTLHDPQEPYVVGLMAFGHRVKPFEGAKGNGGNLNPNWDANVPPGLADDWLQDHEMLLEPMPLKGQHFQKMNAYLGGVSFGNLPALEPWGQTPMLGAIIKAARLLEKRKNGGVVIVITDGEFNDEPFRLKPKALFNQAKDIYLKNSGISLQIVAFDLGQAAEGLNELAKQTSGKFHERTTPQELINTLSTLMKARQFTVVSDGKTPISSDLKQMVENLPQSSNYKVNFPGLKGINATISGGERLEFELDFDQSRLKHRRPSLQLHRPIQEDQQASEMEPNRFGYLKAEYDSTKKRAMFQFCLYRNDQLGIIKRPAEIRIDVTPEGSPQRFSQDWRLLPDQSVPAWRLEISDWPADRQDNSKKAVANAFWKMSRTKPDGGPWLISSLEQATEANGLKDWPDGSLVVQADSSQQGKLVLKLRATAAPQGLSVADIRVELGELSPLELNFQPMDTNWTSRFFEADQEIIYTFNVDDKFDPAKTQIALTSLASLQQGAVKLRSPLEIQKWDDEN